MPTSLRKGGVRLAFQHFSPSVGSFLLLRFLGYVWVDVCLAIVFKGNNVELEISARSYL